MKPHIRIFCIALVLFLLQSLCFADEKIETKFSGLIFANYEYVLSQYVADGTPAGNFNSFDIGRIYLNADAKFSEKVRGFVQLEDNLISKDPWSAKKTDNAVYVKQALLEFKDIYPGAKIMFGLIPNPWRGFEEGIWKHRFVSKILDDIEGLFAATDRGVRLNAKVKNLEYDFSIVNGEGTKGNETNKYKDFIVKLAYSPFSEGAKKGLKLNVYGQKGNYDVGLNRNRLFAGVSYESDKFNAMGTYYVSGDKGVRGNGFSLHTTVNLSPKRWVFARYDNWDPNKDMSNDASSRVILGFGYKMADAIRSTIDVQMLSRQQETAASKNQSAIFYHVEVKF